MYFNLNRAVMMGLVMGLAVSATACKPSRQIVKGVDFRTYEQETETYAEVKTVISMGNIALPTLVFPIYDRNDRGDQIGQVALRATLDGKSEIGLSLNLDRVTNATSVDGDVLPNGQPIPVGGLGDTKIIGLAFGKQSRVYVGLGEKLALFGIALTIPEFDDAARAVSIPLNIFPQFKLANNVRGVAGLFTSTTSGQSGLAVFVDAKKAQTTGPSILAYQERATFLATGNRVSEKKNGDVYFKDPAASPENEEKVHSRLYRLHKKRVTVTVQ